MTDRRTAPLARSLITGQRLADCELRVVDGPDKGKRVKLDIGQVTVGADPDCDLVLTDPTVSSEHAELALLSDGVRVRDLGSTNGVSYLGVRINEAVIQPGSTVSIGQTVIGVLPPEDRFEPDEACAYGQLIGHSIPMRRIFSLLRRLEGSEATVLLDGETGTGKSLTAEMIHAHSARAGGPFVTVDCGQIAPHLLQSELFGHRRGAFTGADADRIGALESARGGTVFLDEVGELPLDLQPSLLRFLETGEVRRVGDNTPRQIDARVIAATNRDLQQRVDSGDFRLDLFYRVSVIRIGLPPLRDCPEDVIPLARRLMKELGAEQPISAALTATLQSYPWPGNVRQLRNALTRQATIGSMFDGMAASSGESGDAQSFHQAKAEMLNQFERRYLLELMVQLEGNLSAASRESGLVRSHLRTLLKKHGIDPARFR